MKKYIKASDGSFVSFVRRGKKTFQPVSAARSVTASTMSRDELIDTLDERFNTAEDYETLEAVLKQVSGEDLEYLDDSDPEEGMYANFTTDMLQKAYDILSGKEADAHPTNFTLDLAEDEFSVVLEAMENFADLAFTKDRELSRVAQRVLRKLRG